MHTHPSFKRFLTFITSIIFFLSLPACQLDSLLRGDGGSSSSIDSSYIESQQSQESSDISVSVDLVMHPLTGIPCGEAATTVRPLAFVLGNTDAAMPQYGTGIADILIEAPCGDDTTKLLVITTRYKDASKIGSIRAAMPYLEVLANAFDATLVHSGSNENGENGGGIVGENVLSASTTASAFYKESGRLSPHNIFTTVSRLKNGLNIVGISENLTECTPVFAFTEEKETISLSGKVATHLCVEYSSTQRTEFRYSPTSGIYTRYQNGIAVCDAKDNTPLTCQNVMILYCDSTLNENAGGSSLSLSLTNGSGVYATDGSYLTILWYRDDDGRLVFTREDGTELSVNPGVTHIELVKSSKKDSVSLDCN